jgi:FKBP-type peptidyl-prolyl cis-trans isomerase FklB
VTFESTMRWLVVGAILLFVVLFAWTAIGQEAPAANREAAGSAATASQSVGTPEQTRAAPEKVNSKTDIPASAVPPEAEAAGIRNWKDKVSYAFGVDLGHDLKRQKDAVNLDLLLKAMKDVLDDKPLALTDDEVAATLKRVGEEQKLDLEHAKMMIGEKNRKAGETFFAENAKKEGVITLPSGLQYKVVKKGEGKVPTLEDRIVCKYKGTLLDGTEFDSSEKRGGQITVPVKGLMAGWTQALQIMPVGSKWQLFIPPQLAYGDKVMFGLGPNTTLLFDVELVSIEDKPQTAKATQAVGAK